MNEIEEASSDLKNNFEVTEELFNRAYDELRRIAASKIVREPSSITLQPTALVHEAWLRLARTNSTKNWTSLGHFLAVAAEVMRRVLVDNARRRDRIKRGGEHRRIDIPLDLVSVDAKDSQLIELDEALDDLAIEDPVKANLVIMRYFGGMTIEQAAEALQISRATATRHWKFARAWLFRRIDSNEETE